MNRYKWTPMFSFWVRWSDCLKTRAWRHTWWHVTGSLSIYISNGDSVLADRLVLRFIDILDFLKIIPLYDTC